MNLAVIKDSDKQEQFIKGVQSVDSIFRLEGFEPTESVQLTRQAVFLGIGTYDESLQELTDYVTKHGTSEGFTYSKTIGLSPLIV